MHEVAPARAARHAGGPIDVAIEAKEVDISDGQCGIAMVRVAHLEAH